MEEVCWALALCSLRDRRHHTDTESEATLTGHSQTNIPLPEETHKQPHWEYQISDLRADKKVMENYTINLISRLSSDGRLSSRTSNFNFPDAKEFLELDLILLLLNATTKYIFKIYR